MSVLRDHIFIWISLLIGLSSWSSNGAFMRNKRAVTNCSLGEFSCRNGKCVPQVDICDGKKNCIDGSDENHVTCFKQVCPRTAFKCSYGGCIDGDKKCDGLMDCPDESDELGCPGFKWLQGNYEKCKSEEFQCRNGQCIVHHVLCDGTPDCEDGSDETVAHCSGYSRCNLNNFRCAYGACIEQSKKCDGKKDCADGSDEDELLCNGIFKEDEGYEPKDEIITMTSTSTPEPSIIGTHRCIAPYAEDTKYSLTQCSDYDSCQGVPPNKTLDTLVLYIYCKKGYARSHEELSFIYCDQNKKWQPPNAGCVRLCQPLLSTRVISVCQQSNGKIVDCNQGVRPGTKSTSDCEQGYKPDGSSYFFENHCEGDGNWIFPPPHCVHDCGILSVKGLVSGGTLTNKTIHPWNAGIFIKLSSGGAVHTCGGTLITPFAVLTAAHCVFNKKGQRVPASKLMIGLGKEYRDYNHEKDIETAQHIEVLSVYLSPHYDGATVNYLYDVALFELKESAKLSRFIMPVCFDSQFRYNLTSSSIGTVVGWGLDRVNGTPTSTLQRIDLPFITYNECHKILVVMKEEHFLTKDKFCAFYKDRNISKAVRSGDSGAGIIFKFDGDRHYIFGLVSTQVEDYVSTFTDIRYEHNLKFILGAIQHITRKNNLLIHSPKISNNVIKPKEKVIPGNSNVNIPLVLGNMASVNNCNFLVLFWIKFFLIFFLYCEQNSIYSVFILL